MRNVLVLLAAVLIPVGCDRPDSPAASPPAAAPAAAPAVPPPAAPSPAPPAEASGLAFIDAAGASTATLNCGSDGLRIVVPGFRPIASEDRLSIGTDGEAFALVANLAAPGPGVTASGPPDPDLLDRLARGEALFAVYGRQSVGPLAASSPAALQTTVSACRRSD